MEGLKKKYIISKTNGQIVNPKAKYIVLRYDENMEDKKFLTASRRALSKFCLEMNEINPQLSKELWDDMSNEIIKGL